VLALMCFELYNSFPSLKTQKSWAPLKSMLFGLAIEIFFFSK